MAQKRHKKNIKAGFVYVVTNEAWPGLVKVGMTLGKIQLRVKRMGNFPTPFRLEYCVASDDAPLAEAFAQRLLLDGHVHGEWFKASLDASKAAVDRATAPGWIDDLVATCQDRTIVR